MNQDVIINRLLGYGVIERLAVRGHYKVFGEPGMVRRDAILARFAEEVAPGDFVIRQDAVLAIRIRIRDAGRTAAQAAAPEPLRRLSRRSYHSTGGGAERTGISEALARIPLDEDGVRRSFGIEYEIYDLNAAQEDKVARALDNLPAHVVETDGSLGDNGCEIVFLPVGAADFVRIVRTLAEVVRDNRISMTRNGASDEYYMAGMHITYGVNNSTVSRNDLQIRLNRLALAVKAVGTRPQIKTMFGRDFGHYRVLPNSTTVNDHTNAFSTHGRPSNCWECRLASWGCDADRMVKFFRATEAVFNRPVQAQDFMKVFELLGADTSEE